jgi:hypothetical protein
MLGLGSSAIWRAHFGVYFECCVFSARLLTDATPQRTVTPSFQRGQFAAPSRAQNPLRFPACLKCSRKPSAPFWTRWFTLVRTDTAIDRGGLGLLG